MIILENHVLNVSMDITKYKILMAPFHANVKTLIARFVIFKTAQFANNAKISSNLVTQLEKLHVNAELPIANNVL